MSYNRAYRSELDHHDESSQNSLSSEVCEIFVFDDADSLGRTPSLEFYYEPSINLGDEPFSDEHEDILIEFGQTSRHCKGCKCHILPLQGHCQRCNCYQESGTFFP